MDSLDAFVSYLSCLNFERLQNVVPANIGRSGNERVIASGEVVRGSQCEKQDDGEPDCAKCDCCYDSEEGDCKCDEQAFVCYFVAEVLSHLSISSVSRGPKTLMPVIYAVVVNYSGHARDRFVKRQGTSVRSTSCGDPTSKDPTLSKM